MKKYFEIGFGLFLIIVGLIGGLIPVLQGWVFGIPGLIILSKYSSFAKKILIWGQKKSGFKK